MMSIDDQIKQLLNDANNQPRSDIKFELIDDNTQLKISCTTPDGRTWWLAVYKDQLENLIKWLQWYVPQMSK